MRPISSGPFQNVGSGTKSQIFEGVCGGPFKFFFFGFPPNEINRVATTGLFCQNFMSSWGFYFYCSRSFDQAGTLSLRGPAQFTDEARSAEFDGMGWGDVE